MMLGRRAAAKAVAFPIHTLGGTLAAKYVVLKIEDWDDIRTRFSYADPKLIDHIDKLPVPDAEVIRKQDITAGPIFHLYSHLLHSYMELLASSAIVMDETVDIDYLLGVADHFHEAAVDADQWPVKKLPD